MADTFSTIKVSAGDYASPTLWEVDADVSAGRYIGEIQDNSVYTGTFQVLTPVGTPDAENYIWLRTHPDNRHAGVWDTGKAILRQTTGAHVCQIYEDYTVLTGLQISEESTVAETNSQEGVRVTDNASHVLVDKCIIRQINQSSGWNSDGIYHGSAALTGLHVSNCLIYGFQRCGIHQQNFSSQAGNQQVNVRGCTVLDSGTGGTEDLNEGNYTLRGFPSSGFVATMDCVNCLSLGLGPNGNDEFLSVIGDVTENFTGYCNASVDGSAVVEFTDSWELYEVLDTEPTAYTNVWMTNPSSRDYSVAGVNDYTITQHGVDMRGMETAPQIRKEVFVDNHQEDITASPYSLTFSLGGGANRMVFMCFHDAFSDDLDLSAAPTFNGVSGTVVGVIAENAATQTKVWVVKEASLPVAGDYTAAFTPTGNCVGVFSVVALYGVDQTATLTSQSENWSTVTDTTTTGIDTVVNDAMLLCFVNGNEGSRTWNEVAGQEYLYQYQNVYSDEHACFFKRFTDIDAAATVDISTSQAQARRTAVTVLIRPESAGALLQDLSVDIAGNERVNGAGIGAFYSEPVVYNVPLPDQFRFRTPSVRKPVKGKLLFLRGQLSADLADKIPYCIDMLEQLGWNITDQNTTATGVPTVEELRGYDLIYVHESVTSSNVGTSLNAATTPVFCSEHAICDDMEVTNAVGTLFAEANILINALPGLDITWLGDQDMCDTTNNTQRGHYFAQTALCPGAEVFARHTTTPEDRPICFRVDVGAELDDGTRSNKRIAVVPFKDFFEDNPTRASTQQLVDATLDWLVQKPQPEFQMQVVRATSPAMVFAGQVGISSRQATHSLTAPSPRQAGDLLIAIADSRDGTTTADPTGYTKLIDQSSEAAIWARVATGDSADNISSWTPFSTDSHTDLFMFTGDTPSSVGTVADSNSTRPTKSTMDIADLESVTANAIAVFVCQANKASDSDGNTVASIPDDWVLLGEGETPGFGDTIAYGYRIVNRLGGTVVGGEITWNIAIGSQKRAEVNVLIEGERIYATEPAPGGPTHPFTIAKVS